ncbi:MAG: O-antigen ligase family protein [Phycisphaerales bacterium]|nr:O-antigen ligase family protein [Phycisphaerales bacterium]
MAKTPIRPTHSSKIALARTDSGVVARQFDDFSRPEKIVPSERINWVGFLILVTAIVGRCVLGESAGRSFPILAGEFASWLLRGEGVVTEEYFELARVLFSAWVLLGCAVVAFGDLRARRGARPWWMIATGVLMIWMATSAGYAQETRSALLVCSDVAGYLAAYWLARRVCVDRRRFVLLVCVLAATGVMVASRALMQMLVENPAQVAMWHENAQEMMASQGIVPGSMDEKILAARILGRRATGFLPLTNLFAGQMLILFSACVAVVALKVRQMRGDTPQRASSEINPARWGLILSLLGTVIAGVALVQTFSRGALGGAGIVILGVAALYPFRQWVRAHWKKTICIAALLGAMGLGAVASWGMAKGTLPTKTMSFRWHYWAGSAKLIAERPMLGVGGGNFADNYLRIRTPEAEEEVKTPHNAIVHSLVQFGLPGGGLFLVLVGWALAGALGPMDHKRGLVTSSAGVLRLSHGLIVGGLSLLAIVMSRVVFAGSASDSDLMFMLVIHPAAVFVLAFGAMWPGATAASDDRTIGLMRVALVMGCVAMVLHNLVSFTLWTPGVGMLLFVAAGAATGSRKRMHTGGRWEKRRWGLIPLGATVAMFLAVISLNLPPLWARHIHVRRMVRSVRRGDVVDIPRVGRALCDADPSDTQGACWMADLSGNLKRLADAHDLPPLTLSPEPYILIALNRNPFSSSGLAWQSNQALWVMSRGGRSPIKTEPFVCRAVEADPMNLQLRLSYLWVLQQMGGDYTETLASEIAILESILAKRLAFNPGTLRRFSPAEQQALEGFKAHVVKARAADEPK